jgi:hypothetical protein
LIVLRIILYIVVFLFSVVYFFPKDNAIEYANEKFVKPNRASIEVNLDDMLYIWSAKNTKIKYNGEITTLIKDITVKPFLVYNSVEVKNIKLYGLVAGFFPTPIESGTITHTVLDPMNLHIKASGLFGKASGVFSIDTQTLKMSIEASNLLKSNYSIVLSGLKKEGDKYILEYKVGDKIW